MISRRWVLKVHAASIDLDLWVCACWKWKESRTKTMNLHVAPNMEMKSVETYAAIIQLNIVDRERCGTRHGHKVCARTKWIRVWPEKRFRKRSATDIIAAKRQKEDRKNSLFFHQRNLNFIFLGHASKGFEIKSIFSDDNISVSHIRLNEHIVYRGHISSSAQLCELTRRCIHPHSM